jgi:uncharacterized protein YjbI with pentapeptide repeats
MTLFKVTDSEGHATNGGAPAFAYPLPGKRPGAWTPAVEKPVACSRGYHLTTHPLNYGGLREGSRIFLAEHRGAVHVQGDKAAFESVRLVAEVTPEWPLLRMYPEALACLMTRWRCENGPDAQWPAWADLSGANLSGANLSWADLSGANLSGADLSRADLSGANLSRADLSGANLSWADLSGANLSGANLSWADLSGANLIGADLSGANLSRANLSRAYGIVVMKGKK